MNSFDTFNFHSLIEHTHFVILSAATAQQQQKKNKRKIFRTNFYIPNSQMLRTTKWNLFLQLDVTRITANKHLKVRTRTSEPNDLCQPFWRGKFHTRNLFLAYIERAVVLYQKCIFDLRCIDECATLIPKKKKKKTNRKMKRNNK